MEYTIATICGYERFKYVRYDYNQFMALPVDGLVLKTYLQGMHFGSSCLDHYFFSHIH